METIFNIHVFFVIAIIIQIFDFDGIFIYSTAATVTLIALSICVTGAIGIWWQVPLTLRYLPPA